MMRNIKLPSVHIPQISFLESVLDSRVFITTCGAGFLLTVLTLGGFAVFGDRPQPDFSKISLSFKPKNEAVLQDIPSQKPVQATENFEPPQQTAQQNIVEDAVAGLHENTPQGLVPMVRTSDGLTAFKAYSANFTLPADAKSMMAIVLTDFGLSRRMTNRVLDLPAGITLVLSPYVDDPQSLTTSARQDSHEVWLKMPLQTSQDSDTGPLTLRIGNSLDENRTRTLRVMARATGYAGIVLTGDISMTPQDVSFADALKTIGARGLGLAAFVTDPIAIGSVAANNKTPFAGAKFSDVTTPTEINAALQSALSTAQQGGKAVVQLPLTPAVVASLESFLPKLTEANITLAPLSAYINQQ